MQKINVSIVYAKLDRQWLKALQVTRGTSSGELVELSNVLDEVDELRGVAVEELKLGIYSQKIDLDYLLRDGDRLEIYRRLTADPKEVRRQLAALGKSIGKK